MFGFQTITDLAAGTESLRSGRYGRIEAVDGRFRAVHLRPYPCVVSAVDIAALSSLRRRTMAGDRCLLYYNQPLRSSNYLVLKYVASSRGGVLASLRRVMEVLEEIARLKQSDALLCDVSNPRITAAMLVWAGWEAHCPSWRHRHYIRRFYGSYPPRPAWIEWMSSTADGTAFAVSSAVS